MEKNKYCDIVQDLLPQYVEKECSETTRSFVAEHLSQCSKCRVIYEQYSAPMERIILAENHQEENDAVNKSIEQESPDVKEVIEKTVHRLRWQSIRRTILSILIILAIIPVVILGYHEAYGIGMAYSNLDDILDVGEVLKEWREESGNRRAGDGNAEFAFLNRITNGEQIRPWVEEIAEDDISLIQYKYDTAWKVSGTSQWNISYKLTFSNGMIGRVAFVMEGDQMTLGWATDSDRGKSAWKMEVFGPDSDSAEEEILFFDSLNEYLNID